MTAPVCGRVSNRLNVLLVCPSATDARELKRPVRCKLYLGGRLQISRLPQSKSVTSLLENSGDWGFFPNPVIYENAP